MEWLKISTSTELIKVKTEDIAFVKAEGNFEDHSSDNEQIEARFYSREEVKAMLAMEEFSSRAQLAAYFFTKSVI